MSLPTTEATGLRLGARIGSGGEADVFEVLGRPHLVYKQYRSPDVERDRKLRLMVTNAPPAAHRPGRHVTIAWPHELVLGSGGQVDGFLMARVDPRATVPLFKIYNPQSRRTVAQGFTWRYLVRAAANLAAIVDTLHSGGYVVGDLNESNLLIGRQALVTLVDCDSIQVPDPATGSVHRCRVGKNEYLAPELVGVDLGSVDRSVETDRFALSVLVFLLLMEGVHPFAGVWRGASHPPDLTERIQRRAYPYRTVTRLRPRARQAPPPFALPMAALPLPIRRLMRRAFVTGLRQPSARPSATEWVTALTELEASLRVCPRSDHHVFAPHRRTCPWCARMAAGLPDPFPAADRPPLSPPEPTVWKRIRRRARGLASAVVARTRDPVARAGSWATAFVAPAVVALALAALRPVAALLVVMLVAPAAVSARAGPVVRRSRWGRWRAPLDVAARAWDGVRISTSRWWVAVVSGGGVAAAILVAGGTRSGWWPPAAWSSAAVQFGLLAAATAHGVVVARHPAFGPAVARVASTIRGTLTRGRWRVAAVWAVVAIAILVGVGLGTTWWPVPGWLPSHLARTTTTIIHHLS